MSKKLVLVAVFGILGAATASQAQFDPDFDWAPIEPQIGEVTLFSISGISEPLEFASWDMGMPGCPGFSAEFTCVPDLVDCFHYGFRFMTGGEKTIRLTVRSKGVTYDPIEHRVCIKGNGECSGWNHFSRIFDGGPCTLLFSDGFESGNTGGWS